jgi:hypothetical protein
MMVELEEMKIVFITLALCGSIYVGIGVLALDFLVGWTAQTYVALGLTVVFLASCLVATKRGLLAVIIAWTGTVLYILFSWRTDASWVFHDNLERFALWAPTFLTIAACVRKKRMNT